MKEISIATAQENTFDLLGEIEKIIIGALTSS
jgi:hypothetical protein